MNKHKLNYIVTPDKPGKLINLDIKQICEKHNYNFNYNKIFYINDLNSLKSRGNHSNSNAKEILVCMNGQFDIYLFDGLNNKEYRDTIYKDEYIFIDKNIWIEFNNFKDSIILAFVDIDYVISKKSIYDKKSYINNIKKDKP